MHYTEIETAESMSTKTKIFARNPVVVLMRVATYLHTNIQQGRLI